MELGNTSVRLVNPAAPSAPESPASPSYGLKSGSLSPRPDFGSIRRCHRTHRRARDDHPAGFRAGWRGAAIAFLISTLGGLLVALNVNQFARISSSPGSLYTYITDHMHPRWGVLAGWALLIAYIGTASAVSAGVTNYANVILRDGFACRLFRCCSPRW